MNILRRLLRWEKDIEKEPLPKIVKLAVLVFSLSTLVGAATYQGLRLWEVRAIEHLQQDIKQTEVRQMDERIKLLKNRDYERNTQP